MLLSYTKLGHVTILVLSKLHTIIVKRQFICKAPHFVIILQVLEAADKIGATDMKKHALTLIAQDFPKVRVCTSGLLNGTIALYNPLLPQRQPMSNCCVHIQVNTTVAHGQSVLLRKRWRHWNAHFSAGHYQRQVEIGCMSMSKIHGPDNVYKNKTRCIIFMYRCIQVIDI